MVCPRWPSAITATCSAPSEFVKEAYNHKNDDGTLKVKPIVGCEFYITQDRHRKTFSKEEKDPAITRYCWPRTSRDIRTW